MAPSEPAWHAQLPQGPQLQRTRDIFAAGPSMTLDFVATYVVANKTLFELGLALTCGHQKQFWELMDNAAIPVERYACAMRVADASKDLLERHRISVPWPEPEHMPGRWEGLIAGMQLKTAQELAKQLTRLHLSDHALQHLTECWCLDVKESIPQIRRLLHTLSKGATVLANHKQEWYIVVVEQH